MVGAFAHSSGYAGGGIYTIAVVNIGHEYAIRHLDHGTQDVSLEPATLAPRMSGAFILDVSLGCNANSLPYPVSDLFTGVVILLPHGNGHIKVAGVPLFVPCGIGESQLGFAKGYDFN